MNRHSSIFTVAISLNVPSGTHGMALYQKSKLNQSGYLSCHGKPFEPIPETEQKETEDLHSLLYTLHTTPIIDSIEIVSIAKATKEDPVLTELMKII